MYVKTGASIKLSFIFVLIGVMFFAASFFPVAAAENKNSYGNPVIYSPKALNANGKDLLFFDYNMIHYNNISSKSTQEQINYLKANKLSLNEFGELIETKGHVNGGNPFNGSVYNKNQDKPFTVRYDFSSILVGQNERYSTGNIKSMLEKGDLSFAMAYRVWLRYYDKNHVFWKEDKSSLAEIELFNEIKRWKGTDGNRWERVNYTSQDKLNLSGTDTWKSWNTRTQLGMTYIGGSYGGPVDTKMENAVLLGKDSKGPKIKTVNVSWNPDGPFEYLVNGDANPSWSGIGTIKKEDVGKTVYIALLFDEPVKFSEDYNEPENLANLKLTVQTKGRDGSSATPVEADFLKYAPDTNTSVPAMIFEYKIQDPDDEASLRKDIYYEFSAVKVTNTENKIIFNNLTDMVGNAFGLTEGQKPGNYSVMIKNLKAWNPELGKWYQKSPTVDLEPLMIESATVTRSKGKTGQYLDKYELATLTINMNKTLVKNASADWNPKIILNVKDGGGKNIEPSFISAVETKKSANSPLRTSLNYQLFIGSQAMTAEGPISIVSVDVEGKEIKDTSGYILAAPTKEISLDKNYYIDLTPPQVEVEITKEVSMDNIYKISADVRDISLFGRDAGFSVTTDLDSNEKLLYQLSTDGSYSDTWMVAEDNKSFSVGVPLFPMETGTKKDAYVFIKLPDGEGTQATKISTTVGVTDEAGNYGKSSKTFLFAPPYDKKAPEIELVRGYEPGKFSVELKIKDLSPTTYAYAWLEGHNRAMPFSWTEGGNVNKSVKIDYSYADNGMTGNEVYERTLWVKVTDASNNETTQFINLTYDHRYAEIIVDGVYPVDRDAVVTEFTPSASVHFKNVTEYAYTFVEWGPEFEADGGTTLANRAKSYYDSEKGYGNIFADADAKTVLGELTTETETVTFSVYNDTPVWRNYNPLHGWSQQYGFDDAGQAKAEEISGPLVLVICAKKDSNFNFEFIPFNTRYAKGNYGVQQIRFSSNNHNGNRVERIHEEDMNFAYGLYYPAKPEKIPGGVNFALPYSGAEGVNPTALNMLPLYDFAEAEFVLRDDPAIGLESLKLTGDANGTKILLKKIIFQSDGSMKNYKSGEWQDQYDYDFYFPNENISSEEIIQSTPLTEEMLTLVSESRLGPSAFISKNQSIQYYLDYRFVLPIDISKITPMAYDDEGNLIRYEFWIEYAYQEYYNKAKDSKILSMFAFDNRLPQLQFENMIAWGKEFGEAQRAVAANLRYEEGAEEEVKDYTASASRVMFNGDNPKVKLKVDMPGNAYNMLANYSISGEIAQGWPRIIYPGHQYTVLFGGKEDVFPSEDSDYKAFYIETNLVECNEDGSFILELEELIPSDDAPFSLYYQLRNDNTNELSPVYRIDLIKDTTPPEITLHVSEREPTNGAVVVSIENVRDGHMVNNGKSDEYYIQDTPAAEIEIVVRAEYGNGEEIISDNDTYLFDRNGEITVTAIDKAGNIRIETYQVNNIDRMPPAVSGVPVIAANNGKFSINATFSDDNDAINAYISFNESYASHLSPGATSDTLFPITDNSAYGIVKGNLDFVDNKLDLEVYAKAGATLTEAILHVVDKAGNVGRLKMTLNLDGITTAVTNENKTYTYGGTLNFSTPVKLLDISAEPKGYGLSFTNLPIYADGPFRISYTDLFGNSYYEELTADIFGAAYKHILTISPQGLTNGNVTVKIDTGNSTATVLDGENANYKEIILSENGFAIYTIIPGGELGQKTFCIPINNIDKISPNAFYTRTVNGVENFDEVGKSTVTGSVTYTILGFDKQDVTMDDGKPMSITFSVPGEYVFWFTDEAGNQGELTVSETTTKFEAPQDLTIAKHRLTYIMNGKNPIPLGYQDLGEEIPNFRATNQDIAVLVEVLNEAGDVLPAEMLQPSSPAEGVQYFTGQNTVVFTKSGTTRVTLKTATNSERSITITIPEGLIDKIPPTGTVEYIMLDKDETLTDGTIFLKGTVKAYLVIQEKDLEVSGLNVRQDAEGKYYIHFAENGNGVFYLADPAWNISSVVAGAYGIDIKPPEVVSENWYSGIAAKPDANSGTSGNSKEDILNTITNNSIRLYFVFNELIRNVEIAAYRAKDGTQIANTADYITYTHTSNTLTIEFKENCQARIEVYDIQGNKTLLWRPEDGPLTVIDKAAPIVTVGSPIVSDNKVSITYSFNEVVTSARDKTAYEMQHTIVFDKNGVYPLTFTDKAGNVTSTVANINQIDDKSPIIYYALKIVPGDVKIIYSDLAKTQPMATNGNVEIAIKADDANGAEIRVVNRNKPGVPLELKAPTINAGAAKTYTAAVVVVENGIYQITATDGFGNANMVNVKIDFIDKTPPLISMENTKNLIIPLGLEVETVKKLLLEGVTANDESEGNLTSAITIDLTEVDLEKEGTYTANYVIKDGLDNAATKNRKIIVTGTAEQKLLINGQVTLANEVYLTTTGSLVLIPADGYILYVQEGYKTRGQMKYAPLLKGSLNAENKGYYTILVQNGDRDMFLVYIYVY